MLRQRDLSGRQSLRGRRVSTPEADRDCAAIVVETTLINDEMQQRRVKLETAIYDSEGKRVAGDWRPLTIYGRTRKTIHQRLVLEAPRLWSPDSPNLYTCCARLSEQDDLADESETTSGVRNAGMPCRIDGAPS